jgi:hypothetical protein
LFSDYLLFAQWHVVTYRIWYGFLFFGTLFAISNAGPENGVWPYALLTGLFFLLFYFELVFALYVSITCGIFALWQYWKKPRKIAWIYGVQILGGITALALLFIQLTAALGLEVVIKDFSATFLARNASAANGGGASFVQFFRDHNIAFWQNFRDGAALRTLLAFARSMGTAVFQIWTPPFYILVTIPFIAVLVSFIEPRSERVAGGLSLKNTSGTPWYKEIHLSPQCLLFSSFPRSIMLYASACALGSAISLAGYEILRPGQVFGIADGDTASQARFLLLMAMEVSLLAMFVAYFHPPKELKKFRRLSPALLFFLTFVSSGCIIFRMPLPQIATALSANPFAGFHSILIGTLCGLPFIGLAAGYFRALPLLPVVRGVVVCAIAAAIVATCPALVNQNYRDIWLPLFDGLSVRVALRVAILLTTGASIAVAMFGARRSFGLTLKAVIGRAVGFIIIGFASYSIVYLLSPGYILSGYTERLAPFAIFCLIAIPAIALCASFAATRRVYASFERVGSRKLKFFGQVVVPVCLVFAISTTIMLWTRVQIYYASVLPPDYAAFAKSLSLAPFKGASFGVNNYAAVVGYYAHNWASMDGALARASIDPLKSGQRRMTDQDYLWFADWKTNADYLNPHYFACMKTPSFDSVLALRDPKRFGNRYAFCDSDSVAWKNSPFNDRIVASDSTPAKFWSIVSLGPLRPTITSITAAIELRGDRRIITPKLEVQGDPADRVTSHQYQLLVGRNQESCAIKDIDLEAIQMGSDVASLSLPSDFHGLFQIRARVESANGLSEWKASQRWIIGSDSLHHTSVVVRCPIIVWDAPFGLGGLPIRATGWSSPEQWGTWTDGPIASLSPIPIPQTLEDADLLVEADIRVFIATPGQNQQIAVRANGVVVDNWILTDIEHQSIVTTRIRSEIFKERSSLTLSFEIAHPASPLSVGLSTDSRALGMGLMRLKITEAASPSR